MTTTKGYSTSGISVLVQIASMRSDDPFRGYDKRIEIAASAMVMIELIKLGRLSGEVDGTGTLMIEVIDTTPVGDFTLDYFLFWMEKGTVQSAIEMMRENASSVLDRVHTSLIHQNVLIEQEGIIIIAGSKQDQLRAMLRDLILVETPGSYAHEALFYTLAAVYSPNAALMFALTGIPFNQQVMESFFMRPSPWSKMPETIRDNINLVLASLQEATRDC